MRYAIVLAFGAAALAQNITQSPAQSCPPVSVITETTIQYTTTTYCPPCNSSTTTVATNTNTDGASLSFIFSSSSSSSTGSVSSLSSVSSSSSVSSLIIPSGSTTGGVIGTGASDGGVVVGTSTSSTVIATGTPLVSSTTSDGFVASTSTTTAIASPPPPGTSTTAPVVSSSTAATSTTTAATSTIPSGDLPPPGQTRVVLLSSLPNDYIARVLYAHNLHRQNASIPLLSWDATLASHAQGLSDTCTWGHNTTIGLPDGTNQGYGQNIGAGYEVSARTNQVPAMITNSMYNGEINSYPYPYGQDSNDFDFSKFTWGHYSQIVWRPTTLVGCATTYCPNGVQGVNVFPPYYTVCNYRATGNVAPLWSNVGTPGGAGTVVFDPN